MIAIRSVDRVPSSRAAPGHRVSAPSAASPRRPRAAAPAEIAHLQDHPLLLARKGATGKLASILCDLADRQGRAGPAAVVVELEMPRADIADDPCRSMETVSRTPTRMGAGGLVARDGPARLIVTDRAGLEAMACADGEPSAERCMGGSAQSRSQTVSGGQRPRTARGSARRAWRSSPSVMRLDSMAKTAAMSARPR